MTARHNEKQGSGIYDGYGFKQGN
ncbi:uncharacterized protein FFM5_15275 [Fusarium fujikuroi]|nr:uncharacterized protein FFM5_15275 [Fusarium fujikuroi]